MLTFREHFIAYEIDVLSNNACVREISISRYSREAYDFQMDSSLISTAFLNLNIKAFACLYTPRSEPSKKETKAIPWKGFAMFLWVKKCLYESFILHNKPNECYKLNLWIKDLVIHQPPACKRLSNSVYIKSFQLLHRGIGSLAL